MNEGCTSRLLGAVAVSHSECVMRAERLWEAARTGLGRSPPAGVCRLTDSSVLVYHTAAAAAMGVSADRAKAHPACRLMPVSLRSHF